MAIAAIGLTAILSLQQQLATNQARYEAVLHRLALRRAAITLVKDINPAEQPSGQLQISQNLSVTWDASPLQPLRRGIGFGGSDSQFEVGLYELTVRLNDQNQKRLDQFTVERLGWHRLSSGLSF